MLSFPSFFFFFSLKRKKQMPAFVLIKQLAKMLYGKKQEKSSIV